MTKYMIQIVICAKMVVRSNGCPMTVCEISCTTNCCLHDRSYSQVHIKLSLVQHYQYKILKSQDLDGPVHAVPLVYR